MIIFHEHRKTDGKEHVLSLRKLKISENVQIRMLLLFCLKFVILKVIKESKSSLLQLSMTKLS